MTLDFICSISLSMIYLLSVLVILLDQISKFLIQSTIFVGETFSIVPFFNLVLTYNKGVSFSFLSSDSSYMPWFLALFSIFISILLVHWIQKEKEIKTRIGLTLILGGALGNAIDRIRIGAVIDFLDFYIGSYHWPAFNIADSAICIGVFFILICMKGKK
mgnify:CR=1 FL=1